MNYGAPKRVEQIPTRPILNGGPALTLRFANSSTTDAAVLYCFLMKIKKINLFTRTYRQIRLAEQKVFDVSTSRTNWSRVNRVYGMILSASTNPPVISVTKAFKTRRRFGADYRKIITIPYRMNEHVISTSGLNRIVRLLTTRWSIYRWRVSVTVVNIHGNFTFGNSGQHAFRVCTEQVSLLKLQRGRLCSHLHLLRNNCVDNSCAMDFAVLLNAFNNLTRRTFDDKSQLHYQTVWETVFFSTRLSSFRTQKPQTAGTEPSTYITIRITLWSANITYRTRTRLRWWVSIEQKNRDISWYTGPPCLSDWWLCSRRCP